jgi:GntR family transcriptional regulator
VRIILSNASPDPIYEQIRRQIQGHILKGELQPGDALPSIRNLAQQLQISVITTKRAYDELERDGFIETVTGKGSFVAPQNPEMLREKRVNLIETRLAEVVKQSILLGLSLEELQEMLELLYREV